MKKIIFLLIFFSATLFSQSYNIEHRGLTDKSSKLRYTFSISYPQITDFRDNVTSLNLFNKLLKSKAVSIRDTFNLWMKDWDTISTMKDFNSYYESGDSVFYASDEIISILFYEGYYFSGAAHPNNSNFSINYNLKTNSEFSLNDIFAKGWSQRISEICIKDLTKQRAPDLQEPDEWTTNGAGPDENNFKVFNITKSGLLITFPTYQVGPYVAGPSEVFIPYSEIKDLIPSNSPLINPK